MKDNSRINLVLVFAYVLFVEFEELIAKTISVLHNPSEFLPESDTEYVAPQCYGRIMLTF